MIYYNCYGGIFIAIVLLAQILVSTAEEKWKWQSRNNARNSDSRAPAVFRPQNDYIANRPLPQYEVGEFQEGIAPRPVFKPPDFQPPRDFLDNRRPSVGGRPYQEDDRYPLNRPSGGSYGQAGFIDNNRYPSNNNQFNRPTGSYGHSGPGVSDNNQFNRPTGSYGHSGPGGINRYPPVGVNGPDGQFAGQRPLGPTGIDTHDRDTTKILTGPVPSWEREPLIKDYDRCKCAASFNCNSPGISFGHCDEGKQYCCYNSKGDGKAGLSVPHRPINSAENGVLTGPGGSINRPGGFNRRPIDQGPGLLVGPGGPTGIIGRPQPSRGQRPLPYPGRPYRPYHSAENDISVGPGGSFGFSSPNRPYGQSGHYRPVGSYSYYDDYK